MLAPVRSVAPAVAILTTSEAKAHLRVDTSDEDTLIDALVSAATSHMDGHSGILGRALITQTWYQDFDAFSSCMRLPVGNLIAISSVAYYDANNSTQTLANTVYTAFSDAIGPYLTLKPDQDWPSSYARPDAIRVTWTAGYGATAASVPEAIRHAARLMVGHWYENREAVNIGSGQPVDVPMTVDRLLMPFRRVGV